MLQSALTLIDGGRLFYRGLDVIELADHSRLEQVAALLWTGDAKRSLALSVDDDATSHPSLQVYSNLFVASDPPSGAS